MNYPLISIVLPTYNGARFLDQSIQSCLNQTYRNWELIIVDDASSDDTPSIIKHFVDADPRIRTIRHGSNRKLPSALNTGFADATGELFTWTSDDNLYLPNALATMAASLEAHPDAGLVYCDYANIDEAGKILRTTMVSPPEVLAITNCIGCCFLYRREISRLVGAYSEGLFLAEDFDYWMRVSMQTRLLPLHQSLYLYRRHDNTLTAQQQEQIAAAVGRTLTENLPKMNWLMPDMRARGYLQLYRSAKSHNQWRMAGIHLIRALRHAPLVTLRLTVIGKLSNSFKAAWSKIARVMAGC